MLGTMSHPEIDDRYGLPVPSENNGGQVLDFRRQEGPICSTETHFLCLLEALEVGATNPPHVPNLRRV